MNIAARSWVTIAAILLAVVPWWSGGRDPVALLVSYFGLAIAIFLLWRRPPPHRTASVFLQLATGVWLVWGALSLLWSVNRYETELWLLYAILGVLVFAVTATLDLEDKARLLAAYTWVAVGFAVYGFVIYATGDYDRLTTSFYWANPAASWLLPATFLSGWAWLNRRDKTSRRGWLQALQMLVLAVAVWLTDSRGALLVAAVVMLASLVRSPAVRRRILSVLAVIIVSFGLAVGAAAWRNHAHHQAGVAPGSRFAAAAEGESTSGSDRLNYLKSAVEIWQAHPLLGTGAGTYATVHPQYQRRVISASSDAHNVLAQTLAEQGLLGLLWLLYVAVLVAWGIWRGVRREPLLGVVAAGAVVVALHFGIDSDDRYPALIALLALLAGACYQPWQRLRWRPARRIAVPVLLVVGLVLALSAYESNLWDTRATTADANLNYRLAMSDYAKTHQGLVFDPTTWTAAGIDDYTLASFTGGSQRYDAAGVVAARAAIAHDHDTSQNYQLLGRLQAQEGQRAAAEASLRRALRLDPWNHPDYYSDLAELQLRDGATAAAQRTVAAALALYPDSVIANRNADTTIKPTVAELLALQAADRLQRGNRGGAAIDVARALQLDPSNADVQTLKAAIRSQR